MTSPQHSYFCLQFGWETGCPVCGPEPVCKNCGHGVSVHSFTKASIEDGWCPSCRGCGHREEKIPTTRLRRTELRHRLLIKARAGELWWGSGNILFTLSHSYCSVFDTVTAMKGQATTLRYHLMFLPPEGMGLEPLVLSPQGRLTLAIWDRLHPDTEKGV